MPIGPRLCLRMDQKGEPLEQRNAARQVATINLRSYGWAERFVYAVSRDALVELHQRALDVPDAVPRPRPDPQVICEVADPEDPDVGAEHPPGYPKGFWYSPPDAPPQFMTYRLQYRDDPRTIVIDDAMLKPQPAPKGW